MDFQLNRYVVLYYTSLLVKRSLIFDQLQHILLRLPNINVLNKFKNI